MLPLVNDMFVFAAIPVIETVLKDVQEGVFIHCCVGDRAT